MSTSIPPLHSANLFPDPPISSAVAPLRDTSRGPVHPSGERRDDDNAQAEVARAYPGQFGNNTAQSLLTRALSAYENLCVQYKTTFRNKPNELILLRASFPPQNNFELRAIDFIHADVIAQCVDVVELLKAHDNQATPALYKTRINARLQSWMQQLENNYATKYYSNPAALQGLADQAALKGGQPGVAGHYAQCIFQVATAGVKRIEAMQQQALKERVADAIQTSIYRGS